MHIVAGSMDAFIFVLNGDLTWPSTAVGFFLPVLTENVIGGTAP